MFRPVRTLKTSEAAALLNVSPNTLRAWERRFGYPLPQRSMGGHRIYAHAEITALRDSLAEGLSISSAISQARSGLRGDNASLLAALDQFELDRADAAMEGALALRPLERCIEEVMLPALSLLAERHGDDSAPWAFAARWSRDWLSRAQRLGTPGARGKTVFIGNAARDDLDREQPSIGALELMLTRTGLRAVVLPVAGLQGLGDLVRVACPDLVVIAGSDAADDRVARWAYAVRTAAGPVPVNLFHRATGRVRTTGAHALPEAPSAAVAEILGRLEPSQRTDLRPVPLPDAEPVILHRRGLAG
jgi:DNA-binding transcriptional MerR regulator